MYSRKSFYKFAKQLMAWSAVMMLFVQPLNLSANDCGCCSNVQQTETATCCYSKSEPGSFYDSAQTCCSKEETLNTTCTCGDQCRCSIEQPGKQLPAIPTNDSQNDQSQSLALTLEAATIGVSLPDSDFGCHSFSVYCRPALTAQQICVLLSRFNC